MPVLGILELLEYEFETNKKEVKKYGINSKRLLDTLHVFLRFNFDVNSMVNAFVEIQDVASEK